MISSAKNLVHNYFPVMSNVVTMFPNWKHYIFAAEKPLFSFDITTQHVVVSAHKMRSNNKQ